MRQFVSTKESYKSRDLNGEVEIIIRDKNGNTVKSHREHNLIKVFAKEILSHGLPYSQVWDPNASSGGGAWVANTVYDEYAPKYILLGASFDQNGEPLGKSDTRFYAYDVTTGTYTPVTPEIGADNNGDLINPIPISDPDRPLKRVESVSFESSYQPTDTPLLDDTVRAINNVAVFETTLLTNEYNGFGSTATDSFTITEVALAGGKLVGATSGTCECSPHILMLAGHGGAIDESVPCTAGGGSTISIDNFTDYNSVATGDQIFLVAAAGSAETYDTFGQVNPYYLVLNKNTGGSDITLDRTPTYIDNNGDSQLVTGPIGIYKSTLRLFSQRILSEPFTKDANFEVTIRWRIFFS